MNDILFKHFHKPGLRALAGYEAADVGGYQVARQMLTSKVAPDEIIEKVKQSGLRGRGGAGFPAGMKWGFVPKVSADPRYLVVNADESEPGTFKDRELMEKCPHMLFEGIHLAAYAIGAHLAFIYIRGEFVQQAQILEEALAEAYARGYFGRNIFGSGYDLELVVHRGAGAYICGEETALLDSLEGYRGQPRLKPPFPAVKGLYGGPTVVNNVETICCVPFIVGQGPAAFRKFGTEKSPGTKIFSVSGPVKRPGNYELPLGTSLKTLIYDVCGGMRDGHELRAVIPGGSSVPVLDASKVDIALDFESVQAAGSMLGSAGVIVMSQRMCMVRATLNLIRFYRHESCGKCTPCREGTYWMEKILDRIEHGMGQPGDLDLLLDLCGTLLGRSFCALGDAAAMPVESSVRTFREEYEAHIREKRCVVRDAALAGSR
ncbi:MAG: NADH-quinone oxidoreductase subunit NuoF [Candidatus Eisenbacteria bacterium]|nr:NADH-quinone oxidoreductase subunit NuoF [Candidatus Eisenbacteria bacterium]